MTVPDLRVRVLSAFGWAAAGRLAGQTVNWAITLVVIRILTPEDYGLMAMAMLLVSALTFVSDGMASGIIQTDEIDDALLRKTFGLLIGVSVAGAGALALAAPLVAQGFAEPPLEPLVRLLSLYFLVYALAGVPDALLVRRLDFKRRSAVEVVSLVLGGLLGLALALSGHGVWSLAWAQLLAAGLRAAGLAVAARFRLTPSFDFRGMRGVGSFSSLVTAGRTLWFASDKIDVLVIGRLLGAHMLGFYVVALHIAALPQNKIQSILNAVAFSAFSSIKQERETAAGYLSRAVGLIAVVAAPVFLGLSAVAPELVPILMGQQWTVSIIPLSILSLALPLRMVEHVIDIFLQASGRAGTHLWNMLFGLAMITIAVLVGAQWGLVGVCVAWTSATSTLFLFVLARTVRVTAVTAGAILKPLARAMAAAGVMYGAVALVRRLSPPEIDPAAELALLIATGAAVYSATIWIIARNEARELLSLVRFRGRGA
jgi:O-antigen/teichoic acid export membrane protein